MALTQVQEEDGTYLPVAFASSKFTSTQIRWPSIEKEAHTLLFGLRKFEHLLFGNKVIVLCDHNPLSFLSVTIPQSSKLIRWAIALTKFNLEIVHIEGKNNVVADFLSRCNI